MNDRGVRGKMAGLLGRKCVCVVVCALNISDWRVKMRMGQFSNQCCHLLGIEFSNRDF